MLNILCVSFRGGCVVLTVSDKKRVSIEGRLTLTATECWHQRDSAVAISMIEKLRIRVEFFIAKIALIALSIKEERTGLQEA